MSRPAREWLELVLEPGFTIRDEDVAAAPAGGDEAARIEAAGIATGHTEAALCASGRVGPYSIECAVLDFAFFGGTLGVATGERLARAFERGRTAHAVVVVTSSGGVRVQEGVLALLQMTRIAAARSELAAAKRPLIAYIAGPTFGGIAVSIVGTADVAYADPQAELGMSGPRAALAVGGEPTFDTAASAFASGHLDGLVPPEGLKAVLSRLLGVLAPA